MIATDVARAILHALLAALIFSGAVRIWQIAAIEALFGAAQAFFQPAYSGLVPQTVPSSLIQDARALTQSVENAAFLIGPALVGADPSRITALRKQMALDLGIVIPPVHVRDNLQLPPGVYRFDNAPHDARLAALAFALGSYRLESDEARIRPDNPPQRLAANDPGKE